MKSSPEGEWSPPHMYIYIYMPSTPTVPANPMIPTTPPTADWDPPQKGSNRQIVSTSVIINKNSLLFSPSPFSSSLPFPSSLPSRFFSAIGENHPWMKQGPCDVKKKFHVFHPVCKPAYVRSTPNRRTTALRIGPSPINHNSYLIAYHGTHPALSESVRRAGSNDIGGKRFRTGVCLFVVLWS